MLQAKVQSCCRLATTTRCTARKATSTILTQEDASTRASWASTHVASWSLPEVAPASGVTSRRRLSATSTRDTTTTAPVVRKLLVYNNYVRTLPSEYQVHLLKTTSVLNTCKLTLDQNANKHISAVRTHNDPFEKGILCTKELEESNNVERAIILSLKIGQRHTLTTIPLERSGCIIILEVSNYVSFVNHNKNQYDQRPNTPYLM